MPQNFVFWAFDWCSMIKTFPMTRLNWLVSKANFPRHWCKKSNEHIWKKQKEEKWHFVRWAFTYIANKQEDNKKLVKEDRKITYSSYYFLGHPVAKHVWLLDRSWIQVECELDFSLNNASLYLTLITAHFRRYLDVLLHSRSMTCLTFSPRDYNLNQPTNVNNCIQRPVSWTCDIEDK